MAGDRGGDIEGGVALPSCESLTCDQNPSYTDGEQVNSGTVQ